MRLALTFPHSLAAPGGGTTDCIELARHLRRAGADVVLLAVTTLGPSRFRRPSVPERYRGEELARELGEQGVEVLRVQPHPAHYLLDGLPLRHALSELLERRSLDAVLGWWNETFFLPALLRRRGIAFGMNAAASYSPLLRPQGRLPAPHRWLRNRLFFTRPLREADVVFARSGFTRAEIVALAGVDPARVRICHLGVDPSFLEVAHHRDERVERLLFFGSLTREKGVFDALEAVARVRERPFRLRIAGWGDEEGVRRRAAQLGIEERVELLGRLERPALREALAWAQLVLSPSHTESFGLANAEAQAAGLPVVAYAVAAVPEVVEDGRTGWLVPLGRTDLLAEALGRALADPEGTWRAGQAARERARRAFSWEQAAAVTLAGLEGALTRRRAGRWLGGHH